MCVSAPQSSVEYLSTFSNISHVVLALSASPPGRTSVSWRALFREHFFVIISVCIVEYLLQQDGLRNVSCA